MIGAEFTGVLHAAQQGRVGAFERLWVDVHPALIRYLRVVAVGDADDIACESWVDVVRRLRSFDGDEIAWRELVFSTARLHAEDEDRRRVWDAMVEDDEIAAVVSEPLPPGEEPFEQDELEGGPAYGLRMALEAVRDLPPEQGQVLMLRRVALLPEEVVAARLGADPASVHTLEQEALDQLGLDAELLAWALGAEPRPVELADEATVVGVFRAMVPEQPSASARMREAAGAGGARVIAFRPPTWRARAGAVAAASAAVLGMGAISAAAYQGVLPDPVQNVMHVVIGAPEPTPQASASVAAAKPRKVKSSTAATKPRATTQAPVLVMTPTHQGEMSRAEAQKLCRAWSIERVQGVAERRSTAFRGLVQAVGGPGVEQYCRTQGVILAPVESPTPKTTNGQPAVTATPPAVTKSTPPVKPTTTVKPPTPTKTPDPTVTTTVPTPTTTTTVPSPTTTTTSGGSDGGGTGSGAGAGSGGTGAQGAANSPVNSSVNSAADTPAAAKGQG